MSTLFVDDLNPGVAFAQTMRISRPVNIASVRPWIYVNNTLQDGDLQLEVLQGTTVLATRTISHTEINAIKTEAFFHGYVRFDLDGLQLNVADGSATTDYIFRFSMINHTLDANNYLSIVREWDDLKYPRHDSTTGVLGAPGGIEIYTYRSA